MRIIINFGDSDFSMFIMDTAKRYCDKYSELLEYWGQLYSKSEYSKKLTKTFADIKYIQQFFIKGVVGEWIKHLEDKEVLDTEMPIITECPEEFAKLF